ncbi:DUF924 family protein [Kiloniella sp. b19]|uniref:DUF924 family protein n=1 Tax=Kiloniella sp. GXU_MW_B19 TaxID=3141326 RepID=UPI0031E0BFFD
MSTEYHDVLKFWFEQNKPEQWFMKSDSFDEAVRTNLGERHEQAVTGALDHWMESPDGCLALIILLDQVPRNIFRGSPRSFASDEKARKICYHMLEKGFDAEFEGDRLAFCYIPLEHSESLADQERSVELFEALRAFQESYYDYAVQHRVIIERFGRFPHRNAVLGRSSTDEEQAFLKQPGSSF